ncbi:hypothetical protein [Paludisphaera rhizosphaerae]|uniref:hypothetical protein n=1 Tax=Paludisphaera rhizosphaerae TaxID=2711216 RepID=UPI0013EAAA9E|nr:hypothetical protein [Paludisphaera rhizosphaerae]
MTAEQFETVLEEIRRRQGTSRPLVRVATASRTVQGRVADLVVDRTDRCPHSPFGIVSIEQPGLVPGPMIHVQVAEILADGLLEVSDRRPALAGLGV